MTDNHGSTAHTDIGQPGDTALAISFSDPDVLKCPFSSYDRLRTQAPVYLDPVTGFFVLTRYEDIRRVLLDPAHFSSKTGLIINRESEAAAEVARLFKEQGWPQLDTLTTNDPPSHKMYRALVERAFTFMKVAKCHDFIQRVCDDLIDGFIADGEADMVAQFGGKLPLLVIADQLGIPPGDIERFRRWSNATVEVIDPRISPEREIAIAREIIDLQQYFAEKIAALRAAPDDSLLSQLIHAEIDGRALTMQELVIILQQLLVAGNETTVASLSHGVRLMIDNPAVVDEMRADPAKIDTFVEEVLRIESPIQGLFRKTTAAVEIRGVTIPAGAIVQVQYGAGNRDAAVFDAPDRPDLGRRNARAHLAFGVGIHACIGNQLARAELRIAFATILRRLTDIRYARNDATSLGESFIAYSLSRLLVKFRPITA